MGRLGGALGAGREREQHQNEKRGARVSQSRPGQVPYPLSACYFSRAGARVLAICTVSDSLVTSEALSSEDRETSLREMIELALDAAITEV